MSVLFCFSDSPALAGFFYGIDNKVFRISNFVSYQVYENAQTKHHGANTY
jgi:hypothetical protein